MDSHKNHPIVKAQKLSQQQKTNLDKPISLKELDLAMTKANKASSCGPDGLPIKFLHKFWSFLRVPFKDGFNYMILNDEKDLLDIFRCSRVRLISKGGDPDLADLANWRPISVLCAAYKLFSSLAVSNVGT